MEHILSVNRIFFSFIFLTFGMLIGYFFGAGESIWYKELIKPVFNPPGYVFGPVWSALYLMMGYSFGYLLDKQKKSKLVCLCVSQFILNLSWTPVFFTFHQIDAALIILFILSVLLIYIEYYSLKVKDYVVFVMYAPYLLWVIFALLLNYNIWVLNDI